MYAAGPLSGDAITWLQKGAKAGIQHPVEARSRRVEIRNTCVNHNTYDKFKNIYVVYIIDCVDFIFILYILDNILYNI